MDEEIKVGDLVHLKSGGPTMTVDSVGREQVCAGNLVCAWFEGTKLTKEFFNPAALRKGTSPTHQHL